jgi:hypothetical protein
MVIFRPANAFPTHKARGSAAFPSDDEISEVKRLGEVEIAGVYSLDSIDYFRGITFYTD